MSENDIKRMAAELRGGCVYHDKRWSGDTHDDLGGSVNESGTDALMAAAADTIDRLTTQLKHYRMAAEAEANLADRRSQEIDHLTVERDDLNALLMALQARHREVMAECDVRQIEKNRLQDIRQQLESELAELRAERDAAAEAFTRLLTERQS